MNQTGRRGLLVVVSGPSGVGKGTVCKKVLEMHPDIRNSISVTTRKMRPIETEGVNYFFRTQDEFKQMIEKEELLEWAEYLGNYYGTPRKFVLEQIENGHDVLLEIEVQGGGQVKEKFPECVRVFLTAPSAEELENRIRGRGTENPEVIESRIKKGISELELAKEYDYTVVNDTIEKAAEDIYLIIMSEHAKRD
jgi:guanylate kinase